MNTKLLTQLQKIVVAVCICVGVIANAHAVHINASGTGQVLLFPYYTVRGVPPTASEGSSAQYETYLSITNSTSATKAIKVIFYEGKQGAPVMAFNVYLGGNDVWTGAVVATPNGARIISADQSCVTPLNMFTNTLSTTDPATPNVFKNGAYLFAAEADKSLDRTREGHIEVIEMGEVGFPLLAAIRHDFDRPKPEDCSILPSQEAVAGNTLAGMLSAPKGGLYGTASLINPLGGVDYSYDAIAFGNWYHPRAGVIFTPASTFLPNIVSGGSLVSDIFGDGGKKISSTWANSRDAVSATMMRVVVTNEFVLDEATASGTDWIVAFPTRRYYDSAGGKTPQLFDFDSSKPKSCERVSLQTFNRDRQSLCDSPCAPYVMFPLSNAPPLCSQTNVMSYYRSQVLASANVATFGIFENGQNAYTDTFANGYSHMAFLGPPGPLRSLTPLSSTINGVTVPPQTHYGLPVVGFMVQNFLNRTIAASSGARAAASYGGQFLHKYVSRISN